LEIVVEKVENANTDGSVVIEYPKVPEYTEELKFDNIGAIIETYVATRDELDKHRKEYNQYEARAKNYMDRLEQLLIEMGNNLGVDSFKTPYGTAYRDIQEKFPVLDWDAFFEWASANGFSHVIERRAAKLAVKEIYDTSGELPPGLGHEVIPGFVVRRPAK
jgi:hypothetical protein